MEEKAAYLAFQATGQTPLLNKPLYLCIRRQMDRSPANRLKIIGELKPNSRFPGNSVATVMDGENRVTLLGKPDDGGVPPVS
jgi:hypothetical protein